MGKHDAFRTPYTLKTLAERWACSDETIRQMIISKALPAFRVGNMLRIPAQAVEDYEACRNTASGGSTVDMSPHGPMVAQGEGFVLLHSRERKPKPKRST